MRHTLATFALGLLSLAVLALATPPAVAQEQTAAAEQLFYRGRYAEAEESYRLLAEAQPAAAALGVARCQVAVGQYAEARQTLEQALGEHPPSPRLHAALAQLELDQGAYGQAQRAAEAALQLDDQHLAARWVIAELHRLHGRLEDAQQAYRWFIDFYNRSDPLSDPQALHYVGLAAAQFARWNRLHDQFDFLVNQLYPDILKLQADFWPARRESGWLFLEKYNQADALLDFQAALKINPHAAQVHADLARLALQNYELEKAKKSLDRALAINPHLLDALHLRADLEFANFEPAAAEKILQEALKLHPTHEATLGRLAAAQGCLEGLPPDPTGTQMDAWIRQAVGRNPHAGLFYEALAESLDTMRRYPQAAHYFREAIRVMPQLVGAYGKLGLVHMRLGEETEARAALEKAFQVDMGNVRVKNSLEVLDVLATYETLETEHFLIRFDPRHDKLLARYMAQYLEEVYPQLCDWMGYEPPGKSLFEVFHRAKNTSGHGWFSARMVGLPHIHTIGACAGKMVALVSPNDMDKQFNWARVVKHELVHVINLQQTNFQIPHWFTEALAVYDEGYPRPPNWDQMLVRRVPAGKMFDLQTINLGFIRPSTSEDWQMAYCQAELYAEYMVARFGPQALARLLDAYADNLDTPTAIPRALGVSMEEFERGYAAHLTQLVAQLTTTASAPPQPFQELTQAVEDDPRNPDLLAALADAYLRRKAYPQAGKLAGQALEIQPRHQAATYVRARLQLLVGDQEGVVPMLEKALDPAAPHAPLLRLLAGLKYKAEAYERAVELYQLGRERFPRDPGWTKLLARVHLKTDDHQRLRPLLAELARHDGDNLVARQKLAQLALADQDFPAAQRWAREALQIEVQDADMHRVLGESLAEQGKYRTAIDEFEVAVQLQPRQLRARFALADAYVQTGEREKARETLRQLLDLDPKYPGADVLLESLEP